MGEKVAVQFSASGLSIEAHEEFARQLLSLPIQAEVYHLEPPRDADTSPGEQHDENALRSTLGRRRTYAAFDWTLIGQIADILGIASFLWQVYEACKRSRTQEAQARPELFISIDPENGLSWFLGRDIDNREVFINDFESRVLRITQTGEAGEKSEAIYAEVRFSGMWIRKN